MMDEDGNGVGSNWRARATGRGRPLSTDGLRPSSTGSTERYSSMYGVAWIPTSTGLFRDTGVGQRPLGATHVFMSCDDFGMGACDMATPSFLPTPLIQDPTQNEMIQEWRAQNRRMAKQLEQRDRRAQQTQVAFTRTLEDIVERLAQREPVPNPPPTPAPVNPPREPRS